MANAPALEPGVWGVLATPFSGADGHVDDESLVRLVELHRRAGSNGLVVLGVFGEAASLSRAERRRVVRSVAEAAGELPIVVGLTSLVTSPAIEEAEEAMEAAGGQVRALMLQVPTPDPGRLGEHLTAVGEATGLGLVVQDYPLVSGIDIAVPDLATAVDRTPGVVAIKAEASPTVPSIAALAPRVRVPIFGGLGGVGLLDELAAGSSGAMTGFSFPEALVEVVTAFRDQGVDSAREVIAPWLPFINFEGQRGVGLAIRKASLVRRDVFAHGRTRAAIRELPDPLAPILEAHLASLPTARRAVGTSTGA